MTRFSGWTLTGSREGNVHDGGQDAGSRRVERLRRRYGRGRVPEVEAILRDFKAKTTQQAIYFEVQYNTNVRFL